MTKKSYKQALKDAQKTPEYMAEVLSTEFISEVWRAMQEQGLSQTDLAAKMGKRRSYLSRVLTGPHNLTLLTVAEFFAALGEEPHIKAKPIGHHAAWITFNSQGSAQNRASGTAKFRRWSDAIQLKTCAPIQFTSAPQTANQDSFYSLAA